jgi:predicted lipoprotein
MGNRNAKEQNISANNRRESRSRVRPWMIGSLIAVIVIVVAGFNVKVVPAGQVDPDAPKTFDAAQFAKDNFDSKIVPQIESEAVDLVTLLSDLTGGANPDDFGHSPGSESAYAFPVTLTAVAGEAAPPLLPLTVDGVPSGTTVVLQIGPALTGTAIRDVTGTLSFNQFTNQLEYQKAATELNNQVREKVLAGLDPTSWNGKTLKITGSFLRVNPDLVSIVPVKIEVVP